MKEELYFNKLFAILDDCKDFQSDFAKANALDKIMGLSRPKPEVKKPVITPDKIEMIKKIVSQASNSMVQLNENIISKIIYYANSEV